MVEISEFSTGALSGKIGRVEGGRRRYERRWAMIDGVKRALESMPTSEQLFSGDVSTEHSLLAAGEAMTDSPTPRKSCVSAVYSTGMNDSDSTRYGGYDKDEELTNAELPPGRVPRKLGDNPDTEI